MKWLTGFSSQPWAFSWWRSKISGDAQWHENRVRFYTSTLSRAKNKTRKNAAFIFDKNPYQLLGNLVTIQFPSAAQSDLLIICPHSQFNLCTQCLTVTLTCCYQNLSCYHCARSLSLRSKKVHSITRTVSPLQVTGWVSSWSRDKTPSVVKLASHMRHASRTRILSAKFISSEP